MIDLWLAVVLVFVVGDGVTTWYGLRRSGVSEGHPIARRVLNRAGLGGLLAAKAVVVIVAFVGGAWLPARWSWAPAAALLVVGVAILLNNLRVLRRADGSV
jgi:hypothetical protein